MMVLIVEALCNKYLIVLGKHNTREIISIDKKMLFSLCLLQSTLLNVILFSQQ